MDTLKRYTPWIISAAVLVVYLCFPTKNYYWDGVAFALDIEAAGRLTSTLLHQNHLVYNVVGYLLYALARLVWAEARAIVVLQVVNSVLSALCAFVLFHVLKSSLRSHYLSTLLTLVFSFSATWWKFSADVDSYVPATLFLLTSFYLLLPGRKPRPVLVALLHTAAMLFHQLAVFFYPTAVVGLLFQTSAPDPRRRARPALLYSAVASLATLAAYYFCFYLRAGAFDPALFVKWMGSYSSGTGGFTFDPFSNLMFTLRGHVRLFWGGRASWLRDFINPFSVALILLLVAAAVGLCVQVVRHFGELKPFFSRALKRSAERGVVWTLAWVWAAPYLVFCFFFYPQDTFHRLVYFPALIVLCGVLLADGGAGAVRPRRWRLALFAAVLALSNFLFLTYPYSHVRANTPLALALDMRSRWSQSAVVYYAAYHGDYATLRYFNPQARWKQLGAGGTEELEREMRAVYEGGGEVWAEISAIDHLVKLPHGAEWLAAHARESYELTDPAYRLKVVRLAP